MNIHTPPPTATSDTVTLQSDSGYFKKKTFYPSESAPSRRIEILRPWGAPGSPGAVEATATVANSDATVIDHTAMPQGWVRVWTHTLGGVQVEKLITASSTAIQTFPNTLLPAQEVATETQVRYIGASTIPTTSVPQTFSMKEEPRLSGRPRFSSKTDGSSEEYVYRFGTWNGTARTLVEDSGSDLSFMRTRVAGGRSDREIAVEDFSRLTFSRQQFRGVGGSLLPVSHDVHEYDPLHHLIKTQRETATGWRTIYEAAWIEDVQASETDETRIVTTFTHTDNDGIPDVETRAALPAANGLPAVPQRIRTRTWDAARVWQTETIKQGTTMLAQRAWRVDGTGRILEETRNDALTTRYEYETGEGEALAVRRFERAAGAAQSTERLVSQTETDRLGRVVAITGPSVIEEHHTYALQANGDTIEEVKRGSLTEAAQRVILQTKTDASGRRVGEMVNVYLGVWRTWEYDALGRLAFERWMGSLSASTSTTMPPPPSPKRPTHRPIRCA